MSTIYVAQDIINDTLVLLKNITTNGNLVLLGNAGGYGAQDSSRIINDEIGANGYLIKLTGSDVSLTVGGDYHAEASATRIYNLYAKPDDPDSTEALQIITKGKVDRDMFAVTAAGDLSLYFIAQTGAYGTGTSYTRTLKNNQDTNIKIQIDGSGKIASGLNIAVTGFDVKGALKVWSDLVGTITVAGVSSVAGLRAASLMLGNNILADISVTAQPFGVAKLMQLLNEADFRRRFETSVSQEATAYGIKADGELAAEYGVWQGGVVSATVKGGTYTGSGAELKNIDLAAFAVSAGGSVFFNHMQSGTISAGLGANTFNVASAIWPLESGAIIIAPPNTISGDRFTAAALAGDAVRVNTAENGLTVAANIAGNAMNWRDAVESGAAVAIGFDSNVFSAAGVSAANELALGDFGATVSGGALNNKFGATYSGGGVFELSAPSSINLNASMQASGNVFAAAGISGAEITSGASLSGVVSARTVGNTLNETVIDFTDVSISGGTASVIVASSLLTRNTTANVSGNTFDAVGVRAAAINSGAETAYAAITSAGKAATVLVSGAEIYSGVLLGSAPTTMADRIKSAVVASGAAVFAPVSGGVNVTADISAALTGNRIGVSAIDSGAAVISKVVNLNVQMRDNEFGATGIDTDVLTLGNYGGAVGVIASSNGLVWTDTHASGGILIYSTTVVGTGNTFDAVGIGAKSLIVDSRFTGTVNVNATGNSGIFDFNVKGIDVDNALFRDNLGGSVTVAFKNNDLKNNIGAEIVGGTAVVTGIATSDQKADNPVLMVLGRINTDINLTVTGNKNFSARPDVSGIQAGVLIADAFSGNITITSSTPGRSLSEADQLQLDVIQDFGLGVGEFRTVAGDAFDMNGSITVNAAGVVSTNALNMRVSGDITANGVNATVSGVTIEILPGYAILGDGKSAISGNFTTNNNDVVELAKTANITGIIELATGVNTITIDSNATVNGSLRATGGLMNLRFDLNGAAKSGAVVTADAEDISLYSTSNITVDLNNAETTGSTAYKLFSYSGNASNGVWLDDRREISFVYFGKTIKKTLTVSGSTSSSVEFDFNEFGYDVKGKLEYKNKAVTVTVTNNATLGDFGGELSTIFDNTSHQAVLSWTDDTEYGAGEDDMYEVEYSVNGGKTITTFTTLKSAVIFGVDEGDTLSWKVRRSKAGGAIVSKWSGDYADTVDMLSTTVDAEGTAATLAWGNDLSAYDRIVVAYSINGGEEVVETLTDSAATSLVVDVSDVSTLKWRVRGESDGAAGSWVVSDGNIVRISGDAEPIGIDGLKTENPDAADGVDASRVRVSWNRASSEKEIANYVVEYFETKESRTADEVAAIFADPASAVGTEVFARTTTATQVLLTSLSNGSYVYWRVKAVDVSGASSEFVNAEAFRMSAGDTEPPYGLKPSADVTYVYDSETSKRSATITADFNWPPAQDDKSEIRKYYFQYKLHSAADWGEVYTIYADDPNFDGRYHFTVDDVANSRYDFRLSAEDWPGNVSDYVSVVNVCLGDEMAPVWGAAATLGDDVTYVYDSVASKRSATITVDFNWDAAEDVKAAVDSERAGVGVRNYEFQYKLHDDTEWSRAAVVYYDEAGTDGKYHVTVDGVANGRYDYRVRAVDFFDNIGEYKVNTNVCLGDEMAPIWSDTAELSDTFTIVAGAAAHTKTITVDFSWDAAEDIKAAADSDRAGVGVRNYEFQYKLSSQSWDDAKVYTVYYDDPSFDGSKYHFVANDIANGAYDYRVRAVDFFDNTGEYLVQNGVWVGDNVNPYWRELHSGESRSSVSDVEIDRSDEFKPTIRAKFKWISAKDNESGVRNYLLQYKLVSDSWDDTAKVKTVNVYENGSDSYSTLVTGLTEGVYDYRVVAQDYFDNEVVTYGTQQFGGGDITPPMGSFGKTSGTVTAEWTSVKTDYVDEKGQAIYEDVLTKATVTVDWSNADFTDASNIIYTVSVANNKTFSGSRAYSFDTTEKSFTFDDSIGAASVLFAGMRTVYYQVSVRDDQGNVNIHPSDLSTFKMVYDNKNVNISSRMYAPTGLTASASRTAEGKSRVKFSWSSEDTNLFGVYDYTLSVTVNGTTKTYTGLRSTSYTLSNLADGKYSWTVRANSGCGTSAASSKNTFTIDATAPTFAASAKASVNVANRDFVISWNAATDRNGIDYYLVHYGTGTDEASWVTKKVDNAKTVYQGNVNLTQGSPYVMNYAIEAVDKYGNRSSNAGSYLRGSFKVGADSDTIAVTGLDDKPVFVTGGVGPNAPSESLKFRVDKNNTDVYATVMIGDKNFNYKSGGGVTVKVYSVGDTSGKALFSTSVGSGIKVVQLRVAKAGNYYLQVTPNRKSAVTKYSAAVAADTPTGTKLTQEDNAWNGRDSAAGMTINNKNYHGKYRIAIAPDDASGKVAEKELLADYVGIGDGTDYRRFDIQTAGLYTFTLNGVASKLGFTIYSTTPDQNGNVGSVRNMKKLTLSPKYDARSKTWIAAVDTKSMLLEKGSYYFSVTAPDARNGKDSAYDVTVSGTAFVKANNADDNWQKLPAAYRKTVANKAKVEVALFENEWVGYGDAVDYRMVTVEKAGRYDFTITGVSNAATMTVYSVNAKDKSKLAKIKSVAVNGVRAKSGAIKGLLLDAGTYYVEVKANNAKKAQNTDYQAKLTGVVFTEGNNADDNWQVAGLPTLAAGGKFADWVGFGDKIDYRALAVDKKGGFYEFSLSGAENNVKFTVYALDTKSNKLKAVKSVNASAQKRSVSTGDLCLNGATKYYLAIEAPNAAKAQNSHYTATMTGKGTFTNLGNETWEKATVVKGGIDGLLTTAAGGDKLDYFDISAVDAQLKLDMGKGKTKVSFYDRNQKAVKVAEVRMADGSVKKNVSGLTLVANDRATDAITLGALDDAVKYLKIEAATNSINTYKLSLIA